MLTGGDVRRRRASAGQHSQRLAAGATIRTLSNVQAGGRTPLSGVVHALTLFVIVLGLGPLVTYVPHAALAGILIKVGIDVIDWRFVQRLHRAPRVDLVLMLVVLLLTVFVNVITAVAVGIVLAGLMSFGAANELLRKFSTTGTYEVLIIDLLDVPKVDGSAALALEDVIQQATQAHKTVFIVGLTYPVARLMGRIGCLDRVRETERFEHRPAAARAAVALLAAGDAAQEGTTR
jgi:SulP family sulfate permease